MSDVVDNVLRVARASVLHDEDGTNSHPGSHTQMNIEKLERIQHEMNTASQAIFIARNLARECGLDTIGKGLAFVWNKLAKQDRDLLRRLVAERKQQEEESGNEKTDHCNSVSD